MNSLRRQVAKARRYQALAADTRVLDSHLGHKKFVELTAERDELVVSIRGLEVRDTELEMQLPAKEEAVTEARFERIARTQQRAADVTTVEFEAVGMTGPQR